MLKTVDSTVSTRPTHDENDNEVLSPPASTELDDRDEGDLRALTDDEDLPHPQPLHYEEEEDGEAIEEYGPGGEDEDMDIDATGGINAGVEGPVSLPTVIAVDPGAYSLP
jgi:hypothetical protein